GNTFQRNLTFTGVYNPDPFGRLRANTRNFRDKVKVERGTFLVTQNELVYSVQNVYVAALRARALVTVAEEALKDAQEQLRSAEPRLRAGTAPEYDVLRARVQVVNIQQNLVTAQATTRRTVSNLVRLLSIDPTTRLELVPIALPPEPEQAAIATARQAL